MKAALPWEGYGICGDMTAATKQWRQGDLIGGGDWRRRQRRWAMARIDAAMIFGGGGGAAEARRRESRPQRSYARRRRFS